jgi:hypothetical protein
MVEQASRPIISTKILEKVTSSQSSRSACEVINYSDEDHTYYFKTEIGKK